MTPKNYSGKTDLFDVAIVGGGIFGLSCALSIAENGKSVVVLDSGPMWSEASAVNAGSLGVQNKLPALIPYTLRAWELWKSFSERFGDIGLKREGGYKIAMNDSEADRLVSVAQRQKQLGLEVSFLNPSELREKAPWISEECVLAAFSPQDGYASPTLVGPLLRKAVETAGGTLLEYNTIEDIKMGNQILVVGKTRTIRARQIAITAGAWSGRLAAKLGINMPISLDVNMVSVTEPARPTIENIVTHARGILTLKQVANGSCLIGGGWQGIGTIDDVQKEINYDQLVHNLRLALRVIPGLRGLNIIRSWAGYEGVTPDSLPYLGLLPKTDNLYFAACARGGFTLGLLMGHLLAELMLTNKTSEPIDLFDPGRFAHG